MEIASNLSLGFTKASIVMLYARIFTLKWFQRLARAMLIIVVMWTVAFSFTTFFQCHPISTVWTTLERKVEINCVSRPSLYAANTISDIVTDLSILTMPLPVIWTLQLSLRHRLAVAGLFLLGAL